MNTAGIDKTQGQNMYCVSAALPRHASNAGQECLAPLCRDYSVSSVQRRSHGKDFTIKSMPRLRNKSDLRTQHAGSALFYEPEHLPIGYADKEGHYTYGGIGSREFDHGSVPRHFALCAEMGAKVNGVHVAQVPDIAAGKSDHAGDPGVHAVGNHDGRKNQHKDGRGGRERHNNQFDERGHNHQRHNEQGGFGNHVGKKGLQLRTKPAVNLERLDNRGHVQDAAHENNGRPVDARLEIVGSSSFDVELTDLNQFG